MVSEKPKTSRKRVTPPSISRTIKDEERATTREQQTKRYQESRSVGRGGLRKTDEQIDADNASMLADLRDEAIELRERLIFLLQTRWTATRYRYRYLESRTGISETSWQNLFLRKQLPTVEMIIACCKHMPTYSLWLMTGYINRTGPDAVIPSMYAQEAPDEVLTGEYRQHLEWLETQTKRRKRKT